MTTNVRMRRALTGGPMPLGRRTGPTTRQLVGGFDPASLLRQTPRTTDRRQ